MAKKDVVKEESPQVPTKLCANCDTEKPVTEMILGAGICHSCAGYVHHMPDAIEEVPVTVETVEVQDAPV